MLKNNQKGFTIIELLVVIVIIGILLALALPNLFAAQARGRDTDRKNTLKIAHRELEDYFMDNSTYPTEADWANHVSDDGRNAPRNETVEYTGVNCDADGCNGYEVSLDAENKNDPEAEDGKFVRRSVNSNNED